MNEEAALGQETACATEGLVDEGNKAAANPGKYGELWTDFRFLEVLGKFSLSEKDVCC